MIATINHRAMIDHRIAEILKPFKPDLESVSSIAGFLIYINEAADKAIGVITTNDDRAAFQKALDDLRQIKALAAANMELQGILLHK